jgi:hypothetical protein
MGKVHLADLRLRNNAGMDYPVCLAVLDEPLDCENHWPVTSDKTKVTCEKCKVAYTKRYPQAT